MDQNLHHPQRQLIDWRVQHAELDARIDDAVLNGALDDLTLRRLKKQRLELRDRIAWLERRLSPPEPA